MGLLQTNDTQHLRRHVGGGFQRGWAGSCRISVRCWPSPSENPPSTWRQSPSGAWPSLVSSRWSLKAHLSMILPPFLATWDGRHAAQNEKKKDYGIPQKRGKRSSSAVNVHTRSWLTRCCQLPDHCSCVEGILSPGGGWEYRMRWAMEFHSAVTGTTPHTQE